MFENELQDLRRHKWRVDTPTRALFTVDDARAFLHDVGFCLEYPLRPPVVAPAFIGAVIGSDQDLPAAKYAFVHPRAKEASELKQRLLAEKEAFEAAFGEEGSLLISAQEFPYFYALLGDRNPKQPPSAGERGEKALLRHTYELIEQHGPVAEKDLRERLGETVSDVALARTLHELWTKLRIVRVGEAGHWDLLLRWAPETVNQGKQISAQEALSALVSKYLEVCVAVEQKDIEAFFGHIVARSRVSEVIKALSAAREFGFISVSGKTLLRNVPRVSDEEKAARQAAAGTGPKRPWQPRPLRSEAPRPAGKKEWSKYGPPREKSERRALETGRPWQKRTEGDSRPRREWKQDAKPGAKPWQKRTEGESRPPRQWKKDTKPGAKPWQKRADGESRPPREWKKAAKPWQKREGSDAAPREGKKSEREFAGKRPWPKSEKRDGVPAKRSFKKPAQGAGFKKSFKKGPKSGFSRGPKPGGRRPS